MENFNTSINHECTGTEPLSALEKNDRKFNTSIKHSPIYCMYIDCKGLLDDDGICTKCNTGLKFNKDIKTAIEQLDEEFKKHKCATCGAQMYCFALNCADSINEIDMERKEFLKNAATLLFVRNPDANSNHCWELAARLWDKRPSGF